MNIKDVILLSWFFITLSLMISILFIDSINLSICALLSLLCGFPFSTWYMYEDNNFLCKKRRLRRE